MRRLWAGRQFQLGKVRDRPVSASGPAGAVAGHRVDTLIQAMPASSRMPAAGIEFAPDGEVITGPEFRALVTARSPRAARSRGDPVTGMAPSQAEVVH